MSDQPEIVPGMHIQPSQVTVQVSPGFLPDGSRFVSMRIEHGTGMTVVFLNTELANEVGKMLMEQATGLQIVKTNDMPGNGTRPGMN